MKIFKQTFLCLFLSTVLISCEDAYEIDPGFILTEESSVNTIQDLERVLLGTYDSGLGFIPAVMANAYPSDNLVIGKGNAGQGIFGILWQYNSTQNISNGIWNSAYNNIYSANRIIQKAESFDLSGDEQLLQQQIIAEALAIRAYHFFELVRFFSPSYDPSSPSGYLVLEALAFDADNIQDFPRNTVGEMISQVNSDIDEAKSLIDGETNVFRFSETALKALESRVNLYVNTPESLNEAIVLTTEILQQKPLADSASYVGMFREDIASSEVIFKADRDLNDGFIGNNFRAGNGDIYVSMSYELAGLLGSSDVRNLVLIDRETEITDETVASEGEYVVGKYIGRDESFPGLHDLIIFRSSEMLLIRAEAYAKLTRLQEAQDDIEDIRAVRGSLRATPEYVDEATALDDILLERRLELAYEGHRFLDLKRFNLPVDRSAQDAQINRGNALLPADNFRFTMPIPQQEIDRNEGISEGNQNPGYNN